MRHEIISIRNARSLAEAYNWAVRNSVADVIVLSHDDVDVLADDFAARLFDHLRSFDALGVVGSTRAEGPTVGWSGHPNLRGWITHHSRTKRSGRWTFSTIEPSPATLPRSTAYCLLRDEKYWRRCPSTRPCSTAFTGETSTGA